jgi:hypothetical protein
MADMKMRRNGEGGYLVTLTPGQLKKWGNLKVQMTVNGLIANKKWETGTDYELDVAGDTYLIVTEVNQAAKAFTVTVESKSQKDRTLTKSYRTWECNDNVIRMVLELHNAHLEAVKKAKAKPAKKKQA